MTLWSILLLASLSASCLLAGRRLIHYFQLESYQFPGYFRTLKRNFWKAVLPGLILNGVLIGTAIALAFLIPEENDWLPPVGESVILLTTGWLIHRFLKDPKAKKPLRYTPRIKRLYAVGFVLFTALLMLFAGSGSLIRGAEGAQLRVMFLLCAFFPALLPLWIPLAGLCAWPIEKGISEMYFRDAQRKLAARPDLIKIGITGSWGKTSVKFILGTILEEKYHTLVTPSSFNTPMGVTKIIRERLEPSHRVFVSEMGARHVGDIKELCRLVHPSLGAITSVGPQHLDTFKTVERVAKTKYELMDALPPEGRGFFADDEGICLELYQKTEKPKTLAGLNPERDDVWAENIRTTAEGSAFLLCTREEKTECRTALLGELNIRNILLSAAMALSLGLSMEQTARGIGKLQPVEHRLQLIPNPGGMTVIDDAFNSNIQGARQAFQVLKSFTSGRRIVVTPGMVELGDQEERMNQEFGEAMAEGCDLAILVGRRRSEAIIKGLKAAGFPEGQTRVVQTLEEATALLQKIAHPGDTVLFENDLPDNYSE